MPNRDKIALILAGGQIIHRQGHSWGEQAPLSQDELNGFLEEDLRSKTAILNWSFQPISHYTLRMCSDLTQLAAAHVREGAGGVVITCGPQALEELAYFTDLVWSFPQPMVFTSSILYVGSQGCETGLHINRAIRAALSESCWGHGAVVCIQDAIYAASDFFQLSNYRRMGFSPLRCGVVCEFSEPSGGMNFLRSPRRGKILDIDTTPARNVEIVVASLGGGDILLNALLDKRVDELDGLVIAGFGNGDVPPSWIPLLRKIMRQNIPIVLASRCPAGRIQSTSDFEGSSYRLVDMGLISAGGLTPLQARIKLALALGAGFEGQDLQSFMQDL